MSVILALRSARAGRGYLWWQTDSLEHVVELLLTDLTINSLWDYLLHEPNYGSVGKWNHDKVKAEVPCRSWLLKRSREQKQPWP
jgi:hypothetical protein